MPFDHDVIQCVKNRQYFIYRKGVLRILSFYKMMAIETHLKQSLKI